MVGEYTTRKAISNMLKGDAYAELKDKELWLEAYKLNRKQNVTEIDARFVYDGVLDQKEAVTFLYEWLEEVTEIYIWIGHFKVTQSAIFLHLGIKGEKDNSQIKMGINSVEVKVTNALGETVGLDGKKMIVDNPADEIEE